MYRCYNMFKSKTKIIMKIILINIFIVSISFSQFKSNRQNEIESIILAPCCYGGIVSEHNSEISNLISNFIKKLIDGNFNKQDIINNFNNIIDISFNSGFLIVDKNKYNFADKIHYNMTDNEILDLFINIYGNKIRAIPDDNFFGQMTWFFPLIVIAIGLIFIYNKIIYLSTKEKLILSTKEILKIENKIKKISGNKDL